jgi:dihydrolipoamide dehydrogenase
MLDHIAGNIDREMSSLLQKTYEKRGIEFNLNCKVTKAGGGFVEIDDAGITRKIPAERVLMSVGRRPVIKGFGLESIGVYTEHGRIVADAQGRTNVPGVFAIGDANGVWMLAHAAYREAEVAVNTILGKKDTMRYDAMPSVIYTNPEMAVVGETEETCREKGIAYKKRELPMGYSGRYLAENDVVEGKIKVLFDESTNRMIGCHMVGSYASEIILSATIMVETQMRVEDMKEIIFPHPTVGEIIREVL